MNKTNKRLKFRAWIIEEQRMVYQGSVEPLQPFMLKYANNYLMQSTGVYAMNGREIYENDIVREKDHPDHTNPGSISRLIDVTWESTAYYNGWSVLAPEKFVKYECLGNLYENPDLIITLYNEANEKICALDKELDIALNRIRELNDPCATVLQDLGTTPLEDDQCSAGCNCFRNSTTCCTCNSKTNCCDTGYEEEVDFGDSNDSLDAMMADDNGECDKNESCCGNDSEAEEEEDLDSDKILEPLEESDRGALILLMRNISNLREENAALRQDAKNTQKLQLLKVITDLKAENTKLLEKFNNNY